MANVKSKSDIELMRLYAKDSGEAFDELYRRYSGKVMGYALKKIRIESLANEAFQEVFLKLHRIREKYDGSTPFSAWLFVIARTTIIDVYRRNKKYLNEAGIEELEIAEPVRESGSVDLSKLNSDELELIKSRFFDGESYKEISEKLNKSEASMRKKLSRIIEKLRLSHKESGND